MLLSSCCKTQDSRVADGYPYSGNLIDLHIVEYNNHPSIGHDRFYLRFDPDSFLITDTSTCNNLFRRYDLKYNCNIDFAKYNLILTHGHVNISQQLKIQKRALINHKTKICTIEIRGYTKICGSPTINTFYFWDFILIPRIPDEYTFEINRFYPIL
jgi:hypothetical protein